VRIGSNPEPPIANVAAGSHEHLVSRFSCLFFFCGSIDGRILFPESNCWFTSLKLRTDPRCADAFEAGVASAKVKQVVGDVTKEKAAAKKEEPNLITDSRTSGSNAALQDFKSISAPIERHRHSLIKRLKRIEHRESGVPHE
jgi:hypothetical protein